MTGVVESEGMTWAVGCSEDDDSLISGLVCFYTWDLRGDITMLWAAGRCGHGSRIAGINPAVAQMPFF
jgi:hypothetical protein